LRIERLVDAMFLEDVRRDARQLLNGLETIEELFEHLYVGPAAAKAKKAKLDATLKALLRLTSKCF
jgi:hypothetical protein